MDRNFSVIKLLCVELCRIKTGEKKPKVADIKKVQDFWVGFLGFKTMYQMTSMEIRSLEQILISRINSERKRLGLPGISDWLQL